VNRPRALEHKRSAEVVGWYRSTIDTSDRREVLAAPYMRKWALMEEANRQAARGQVEILSHPRWVSERSQWEITVRRLKDPPPAWRKPVLIGAAVAGLAGGLVAAGWWLLATLAALPGAVLLALILVAFVAFVAKGHGGSSGKGVDVSVTTTVRVRVR
jgi:hypothetical protein